MARVAAGPGRASGESRFILDRPGPDPIAQVMTPPADPGGLIDLGEVGLRQRQVPAGPVAEFGGAACVAPGLTARPLDLLGQTR